MEFTVQSPETIDIQFDRDDLVGISLGGDDPIFKRGLALDNMYRGIVDESGAVGTMGIEDAIESEIENDEDFVSSPGVLDMMPDETDLSMDGMDADDEIESSQEILSGEADDDIDILDYVENMPLQEEVKNITSKDIQNDIAHRLNSKSSKSITAKDIERATSSESQSTNEDVDDLVIETSDMLEMLFNDL